MMYLYNGYTKFLLKYVCNIANVLIHIIKNIGQLHCATQTKHAF